MLSGKWEIRDFLKRCVADTAVVLERMFLRRIDQSYASAQINDEEIIFLELCFVLLRATD
jgi:hypothetical protein